MRKLLLLLTMLGCLSAYAQTNAKEEVYTKIESSYAWINYQMLETYATLHLNEEHWAWILKNEYLGLSPVNNLGNDMASFYEITADARINSECRYKSTPECLERIKNMPNKIYVVMNATNLKVSEINMKLAMHALSTIGAFIGSDNIYGTKAGWRPKTNSTKFVLNIDNGTGQPKVAWSADGSVATITMFVGAEAPDWRANMLDKLNKGK